MLLSSFLIILAMIFDNKFWLFFLAVIIFSINIILKTDMKNKMKNLKYMLYFLSFSLVFQIIYINEGRIIYSFWKIHITDEGINRALITLLRVISIILSSYLIKAKSIMKKYFAEYILIFKIVIKLSPEIFKIIKKRMRPRLAFKYILKKVYKEIN